MGKFVKMFTIDNSTGLENQVTQELTDSRADNYYGVLRISPRASFLEIRQAYRELSKLYHPDTTELPPAEATVKFQRLSEAYSTLSSPEKRSLYDLKIGYFRPPLPDVRPKDKSAYLDATERPLSGGEIFALFILALTLSACLLLALIVGMLRGDELTKLP